jgi:hypothetical protein
MSVSTPLADYLAMLPLWQSYRDAYEGREAVIGRVPAQRWTRNLTWNGMQYLPRPAGMRREEQYAAYRDRPAWVGATEAAVHWTTGAVFRHEPDLQVPARLEAQVRDITQTGISLRTYAEALVREVLLMGRTGILVDIARDDAFGPVPFWRTYCPEEIINWFPLTGQPTWVVLSERVPVQAGPWGTPDFFIVTTEQQYRVLRLTEQGVYEVSLWREPATPQGTRTAPILIDAWIPTREKRPLTFLPFVVLNPFVLGMDLQKSLLHALIERNFLCWRHSADYEHALHKTAMPTTVIGANVDTPPELYLGGDTALFLPDNQVKAFLLEFHGHGLGPFEHVLLEDLKMMASFGAKLLEGPPTVAETATGVQWRLGGSDSPMQSLVSICSQGITWALQVHAYWQGATEDVDDPNIRFTLNKDLVSAQMAPQMLQAIMQARLNRTISWPTYYYNLQQGELTRPGVDADEEQALLDDELAQMPLVTPSPGTPPPGRNGTARAPTV